MWLLGVIMLVSGLDMNAPHVDQSVMYTITSHVTEAECLITTANVQTSIDNGRPVVIANECHFDENYEQGVPLVDLEAMGAY